MPFVRTSRDKRGYEHIYLIDTPVKRGRQAASRVLYWFRTPPGVKVGREPFDDPTRRTLEARHPNLIFDWKKLANTPMPPPDTEHWRERRRLERTARQARAADEREETEAAAAAAASAAPAIDVPDTTEVAEGAEVSDVSDVSDVIEPVSGVEASDRAVMAGDAIEVGGMLDVAVLAIAALAEPGTDAMAVASGMPGIDLPRRRRRRGGRRRGRPQGPQGPKSVQGSLGAQAGAASDGSETPPADHTVIVEPDRSTLDPHEEE